MKATLVATALVLALFLANPAQAVLVANGVGTVTFPSCTDTPDVLRVAGREQGSSWTFVILDTNTEGSCEVLEGNVFDGRWNPAIGGCLKSLKTAGPVSEATSASFCLRKPVKLATGRYAYDVWSCLPLAGCVTGDIVLTFTNVAA